MIAQSFRDIQSQGHFTFYSSAPIICGDKTRQGYVYKRTLKLVGYFFNDILAMPMIKRKLLVKHTLASLLSVCYQPLVYKFDLNRLIHLCIIVLTTPTKAMRASVPSNWWVTFLWSDVFYQQVRYDHF